MQRVFGTVESDSERYVRNSFVMVLGEENEERLLHIVRVLLLQNMSTSNRIEANDFALLQYMKCTSTLDNIDGFLVYMFVPRNTDGEVDHT